MWIRQTHPRSAMESILSSYSRNPGETEKLCLIAVAKHFLSTSHIPLMFYTNPLSTSIRTPVVQHAYVDAGETGETDGSGRKSIIIKMGLVDTPSGGIFIATNKVQHSNSTPADEAEALVDAIGRLKVTRALSEDFAGVRNDAYITDEIIVGSPEATQIYIRQQVADAINSVETSDTDCVVRTQAIKCSQQRRVHISIPASEVFEDNEIVVKIANGDGSLQLKGLRGCLRIFGAIHKAIEEDIIKVVKIASSDNDSNEMSKIPSSPLAHVLSLQGMVGKSDEMDDFRLQAKLKFGKSPRSVPAELETEKSLIALAAVPSWTQSVSKQVFNLLEKSGYFEAHTQEDSAIGEVLLYNKSKPGIGYFAAAASLLTTADKVDYSLLYIKCGLPDPQSNSTIEKDNWDALVRANSNNNTSTNSTEYFERAIADDASMEIQINMVNCQKELEELEYDREVLAGRIAVHKATLLANAKKRGVEDSNRESQKTSLIHREERKRGEEKFTNGGVQFKLGAGNVSENIFISEKKQSPVTMANNISEKPDSDQSLLSYQQMLSSQNDVEKSGELTSFHIGINQSNNKKKKGKGVSARRKKESDLYRLSATKERGIHR
jgi:hypothetical protein